MFLKSLFFSFYIFQIHCPIVIIPTHINKCMDVEDDLHLLNEKATENNLMLTDNQNNIWSKFEYFQTPNKYIKTELLDHKSILIIRKINHKIENIQKSTIKNINNYFQLTELKGMIIEEYVRIAANQRERELKSFK